MPVQKPNPAFFKPILPKHPRLHHLFGTKFFKNHRFSDNSKWTPQLKTTQYYHMANLLQKYNELRFLEKHANKRKILEETNILKQECLDGRSRLTTALKGDQQTVRNLLLDNVELQRLYSNMSIYEAVVNIDQRTFVKRREKDRLQYELNNLMKTYQLKLNEKALLEDRIAFEADFMLPEEFEIKQWRKAIKNSQTRIRALKAIHRAYQKMSSILLHDSIYYEPVLESLEKDVEEQANFIDHVVLLGIPAMQKHKFLSNQLKLIQSNAMTTMRVNSKVLALYKKELSDTSNNVKRSVRKSAERELKMRVYIRETKSIIELRQETENIERQINILQTEFCSPSPKTVHLKIKQIENQNKDLANEYKFKEQLMEMYSDNAKLAEGQVTELKNNNREDQIKRVQSIKEIESEIQFQKDVQKQAILRTRKNSQMLMMFSSALNNLIQVLNRFGVKSLTATKLYPTRVLNLPLLNFGQKHRIITSPNKQIEDTNTLITTALEKLEILNSIYTKAGGNERAAKVMEDLKFGQRISSSISITSEERQLHDKADTEKGPIAILDDEEKDDPNVPNRKTVKEESAKIVLERAKKEWE